MGSEGPEATGGRDGLQQSLASGTAPWQPLGRRCCCQISTSERFGCSLRTLCCVILTAALQAGNRLAVRDDDSAAVHFGVNQFTEADHLLDVNLETSVS